jgi:hypothetical protein
MDAEQGVLIISDHRKSGRGSPNAFPAGGPGAHIVRCWHEWEFDGPDRRIILCLETELELEARRLGLADRGSDGFNALSPINSIRIVPAER